MNKSSAPLPLQAARSRLAQFAQRVDRAARMRPAEIRTRLAQEAAKQWDAARWKAGLGPVRPAQLFPAPPLGPFYFEPSAASRLAARIQARLPAAAARVQRQAARLVEGKFDLLGYEGLDFGDPIDWSLDPVSQRRAKLRPWPRIPYLSYDAVGDHKVVWELNRHQHLVTLARASLYSGDRRLLAMARERWRNWRTANPYPLGINWTSALEVACRSVSWLWLLFLQGDDDADPQWTEELTAALGLSARYLERFLSFYFSPNTHLLGEAAALYMIGSVCRRFRAAERWKATGRAILLEQSQKQFRTDGFHFEQSVYYHVFALDILLHFRLLAERNRDPLPLELDAVLQKAGVILMTLSGGGAAPRFGDDDGGRWFDGRRNQPAHLLDPLATLAALYRRSDFRAASNGVTEEALWLLGPAAAVPEAEEAPATEARSSLNDGCGYRLMASAEQPPRAVLVDAGPHGALSGGHGHADALSIQMIRGGRHWLVDPGTYCYPAERPERNRFRGTQAHNTVCIDGLDQATPTGPFSWARFPQTQTEIWLTGGPADLFVGRHDGYRPLLHRRILAQWQDGMTLVCDQVEGAGEHGLEQTWQFGPDLRITAQTPEAIRWTSPEGDDLWIAAPALVGWERSVETGLWSPAYGSSAEALAIKYRTTAQLPNSHAVLFSPSRQPAASRLEASAAVGYRWENDAGWLIAVLSSRDGAWSCGRLQSDAALLLLRRGPTGTVLLAVQISQLAFRGARIFHGKRADWVEWTSGVEVGQSRASDAAILDGADWEPLRNNGPEPPW